MSKRNVSAALAGCVGNPGGQSRTRESQMMKANVLLTLLALGALFCGGGATTTQTTTDRTTSRVHRREELRKTGESQTGPALEKTDAAIRTEGNR